MVRPLSNSLQNKHILDGGDIQDLLVISFISVANIITRYYSIIFIAQFFTIIFILYAIIRQQKNLLPIIVHSLSNSAALSIFSISASVCICAIYVLFKICKNKMVRTDILCVCMVFLVYSLQFLFRFADINSAVIFPIKLIIVILFFSIYTSEERSSCASAMNLYKTVLFGIIGILVNSFSSFVLLREARLRVLLNDSNMLATEAVVFMSIICVLYFKYNIGKFPLFAFCICSMLFVTILSGSRMGLLILAMALVLTGVFNLSKRSKLTKLICLLLVGGIIILISDYGRMVIAVLIERSKVYLNNKDFSNGRFEIWEKYIEAFNASSENWLLGFGNYTNVGLTEMAHNGFLEDIASNGLIGCGILLVAYSMLLKQCGVKVVRMNHRFYYLLPFIIIFVSSLTLRGYTSIITMTLMYLSVLLYYLPDNLKKEVY